MKPVDLVVDESSLQSAVKIFLPQFLMCKLIRCFQKQYQWLDGGAFYTFFHIQWNGQLCTITYIETFDRTFRELLWKVVDKEHLEKWELYHWEPKDHVMVDNNLVMEIIKNATRKTAA
jgi:hypothetical protein